MPGTDQKTYGAVLAEIDEYLGDLKEKRASSEDATTHPVQSVDDQTQDTGEGSRSSENTSDVKSDILGGDIDSASGTDAETPNKAVAMTDAAATGEDPANETASTKGTKEDGTTSHPANAEDVGEKYSSFKDLESAINVDPEKVAADLGNSLMADIAVLMGDMGKKAAIPADVVPAPAKAAAPAAEAATAAAPGAEVPAVKTPAVEAPAKDEDAAAKEAEQAGYDAAAAVYESSEKTAEFIKQIEKEAEADAELLASYYVGLVKGAMGSEDEIPANEVAEGEAEGTSEGEGAELPPEDVSALAAAAEGEGLPGEEAMAGGMPGEEMAMGPEGIPPEALAEGLGAEEGMGAEGDMGALGGAGEEEVVQALSEALAEAGVSPEELAQAVAAEQSGMQVEASVKTAAIKSARQSVERIEGYRKLEKEGKAVKKASIELKYQVRQMIREYLGR